MKRFGFTNKKRLKDRSEWKGLVDDNEEYESRNAPNWTLAVSYAEVNGAYEEGHDERLGNHCNTGEWISYSVLEVSFETFYELCEGIRSEFCEFLVPDELTQLDVRIPFFIISFKLFDQVWMVRRRLKNTCVVNSLQQKSKNWALKVWKKSNLGLSYWSANYINEKVGWIDVRRDREREMFVEIVGSLPCRPKKDSFACV